MRGGFIHCILRRSKAVYSVNFDYARNPDKLAKSQFRKRTREEFNAASVHIRQRIVDGALAKISTLVPSHYTYEEFKDRKKHQVFEADRSRQEVTRRLAAVQAAAAFIAPAMPPSLELSRAIVMLTHGNVEVAKIVIGKMAPETALAALKHVSDQAVKNRLILRSLGEGA